MNCSYRSLWNDSTGTFVAVPENASSAGKKASSGVHAVGLSARFALQALAVSVMLAFGVNALAQPTGGVVASGDATISTGATSTTITQSTQNAIINWQSFSIAAGQSVQFVQPNSTSVTLNRVLGADPSSILGSLSANGQVFLVNPNGILFGQGASVNVGGLLASTLDITNNDFLAGNYKFSGNGTGAVLNQGSLNADGGYVALLGANVSNQGTISAQLGSVVLAAGSVMTMDVAGDGLLNIAVTEGAVDALVQNGGLIRADGGQVLLTTQAAGSLLQNAVNNTGVIQAQTLVTGESGSIMLMGGMESGTVNVGGTLDASAPNGGNGGFIETSAAYVKIENDTKITSFAPLGLTGTWLIDPQDFTISATGGDISGATLSALLVTNSVVISTATGTDSLAAGTPPVSSLYPTTTAGNGDIFVNDAVEWTASSSPTTLSLLADRDVNVNEAISATNGNLVVCCGRDINVNAAITTTNGSVLMGAGNDINLNAILTTTDGNITMCAANDVNISAQIVLTRGSTIPAQSLDLPIGLVISAGYGGTGPGVAGGTVNFALGTPKAAVTVAPVTINYNPVAYTTPTNYLPYFTLTEGATLTQHMLVFPDGGSKTYDGTTTTTLSGLKGSPTDVILIAGSGSTANFDTPDVGFGKTVTFDGYSLGGTNAGQYILATSCCGPAVSRTTANITAVVVPPVDQPATPPIDQPIDQQETFAPELPYEGPFVNPRTTLPTWVPVVVLASTPEQLQSLTPPVVVAPVVPVETPEVAPTEEVIEAPVQPPAYVAPVRPRKQDRN